MGGSFSLITVPQQQPQSQTPSGTCQLCHGFSSGEFSFSRLTIPLIHYVVLWYLLWCLVSVFMFPRGCHVGPMGAQPLGFAPFAILQDSLSRHMCSQVMVCGTCQEFTKLASSTLLLVEGSFMQLIQFLSHSINKVGHTALEAQQRVGQFLHLPYMAGRGLLFQVVFHPVIWLISNWWWILNLVILVR